MIVRSHIPSGLATQRHARPATMSAFILVALILISAFFSASEIALTASRRTRLQTLADDGDTRALRVLQLKDTPGNFFTVVQIGVNARGRWPHRWATGCPLPAPSASPASPVS